MSGMDDLIVASMQGSCTWYCQAFTPLRLLALNLPRELHKLIIVESDALLSPSTVQVSPLQFT